LLLPLPLPLLSRLLRPGARPLVPAALSIKYTDSIMKTIATTGSVVLTTLLNAAFLQGPFGVPIWSGALIVIVSVFNYNDKGDAETPTSPRR
jgi:UDP-sugar transporter A1/2/3